MRAEQGRASPGACLPFAKLPVFLFQNLRCGHKGGHQAQRHPFHQEAQQVCDRYRSLHEKWR